MKVAGIGIDPDCYGLCPKTSDGSCYQEPCKFC